MRYDYDIYILDPDRDFAVTASRAGRLFPGFSEEDKRFLLPELCGFSKTPYLLICGKDLAAFAVPSLFPSSRLCPVIVADAPPGALSALIGEGAFGDVRSSPALKDKPPSKRVPRRIRNGLSDAARAVSAFASASGFIAGESYAKTVSAFADIAEELAKVVGCRLEIKRNFGISDVAYADVSLFTAFAASVMLDVKRAGGDGALVLSFSDEVCGITASFTSEMPADSDSPGISALKRLTETSDIFAAYSFADGKLSASVCPERRDLSLIGLKTPFDFRQE